MNAGEALQMALAAGIQIKIDGDDLVLEAAVPPPQDVLERLSRNKLAILAILRERDENNTTRGPPPAFTHFCEVCGKFGAFGSGVNLRAGQFGTWHCFRHWPNRPPPQAERQKVEESEDEQTNP